ncbi:MAG TPA: acyltransferase family protein [Cyclobacteriaceae bacterium]|nr:acyltransferase family protein [Cyclobacteriaceae bacterium]
MTSDIMNDMTATDRRYDIDWVRVIAIGLLLIYHVAIGFQPWGMMIAFITNNEPWTSLWIPMSMLNVWRIPLLFFVSGMGVYFALQNRNGKQLIAERAGRILIPFLFGAVAIVPIHAYLWQRYYHYNVSYTPGPGHLWFLANIFIYVMLFTPLFLHLKRNQSGKLSRAIACTFRTPLGLIIVVGAFILEAIILKPFPYEMYAMTWHGFFLGLLAFFFGFCFVLSGQGFWNMIVKYRWVFLTVAVALFLLRTVYLAINNPVYLLVTESQCWIISVLAFGHRYLNRGGKVLAYLSKAAYPVYILHMIFLYLGSVLIFPLSLDVRIKFVLVLLITAGGCFACYEIIRRIKWLRPLFGLKFSEKNSV